MYNIYFLKYLDVIIYVSLLFLKSLVTDVECHLTSFKKSLK